MFGPLKHTTNSIGQITVHSPSVALCLGRGKKFRYAIIMNARIATICCTIIG